MNFFKTRFFCILLIIAIVLALVPAVCTATGNTYILTNLINTVVTPAERLLADICDGLSGYGRYFSAIEELRAENDRLREELAAYISRVEDLENASRDYEWLSAYIGMKKILEESEYVRAEICRRTDVGGSIRYVIDKGSIVACDTHENLLKTSEAYREIYRSQMKSGAYAEGGEAL
jgi:cell shape-determining protein MreC